MQYGSRRIALGLLVLAACSESPQDSALEEDPAASEAVEISPSDVAAAATLTELVGDVRVQGAVSPHWSEGILAQELFAGESVQTMALARATVLFRSNGVSTELEAQTTLRIPNQTARVGRLRHLSGQLRARLEPDASVERLEVSLPPGELVLHRSQMGEEGYVEARIEIGDEVAEVAMLSGRGRLAVGAGPERDIDEAHYVQISMDGEIVDEGADLPPPGELLQPGEDAEILTRGSVHLRWAPVAEVERYEVRVEGPGEVVTRDVASPELRLALSSGEYTWSVRALSSRGHGHESMRSHFRVVLDRTPPRITLRSPDAGEVVRATALIVGRTEPGATLTVNGAPLRVSADGGFRTQAPVRRGLTNIVVVARDSVGNSRTLTRSVLRQR